MIFKMKGFERNKLSAMKIIKYPDRKDWVEILLRPSFDSSSLEEAVKNILDEVKEKGRQSDKKIHSSI